MKNISKIAGLFLVLILTGTFVHAQKCKYDYDKKDEFTGKSVKGITVKVKAGWFLGINKSEEQYDIGLFIQVGGDVYENIAKGDTLSFKLSNGEIITLYSNDRYLPVSQVVAGYSTAGVVTTYRASYGVSQEQLQQFSQHMVTHIRMNVGSLIFHTEMKEKEGNKMKAAATCILK